MGGWHAQCEYTRLSNDSCPGWGRAEWGKIHHATQSGIQFKANLLKLIKISENFCI